MDISSKTMTFTEILAVYEKLEAEGVPFTIIPPSGDDLDSPERIAAQKARGPRRGDLWSAGDSADSPYDGFMYVLVLAVDDKRGLVRIVPVSNDPRDETDDSLVIEDTPLEEPLVVWPTIVADIPARLLYKPLKGFSPEVTGMVEADTPGDGVRRGRDHAENDSLFVDNREDHAAILLRWCLEE